MRTIQDREAWPGRARPAEREENSVRQALYDEFRMNMTDFVFKPHLAHPSIGPVALVACNVKRERLELNFEVYHSKSHHPMKL
jgi:hypothetical protein